MYKASRNLKKAQKRKFIKLVPDLSPKTNEAQWSWKPENFGLFLALSFWGATSFAQLIVSIPVSFCDHSYVIEDKSAFPK